MKKIAMCLVAVAAVAVVMTGCKTTYTNDMAADSKSAMVPAVFQLKIEHKDTKVEGEATVHTLFSLFSWGTDSYAERTFLGGSAATSATYGASMVPMAGLFSGIFPDPVILAKKAASYNACKAAQADLLIGAKYIVVEDWYFVYSKVNCKVSGYPGFEKGVEKAADFGKASSSVIAL